MTFFESFSDIYRKTRSFSLSAARKVEDLTACFMTEKDTIIALQGDVIAAKNEQLAHVQVKIMFFTVLKKNACINVINFSGGSNKPTSAVSHYM